MTELSPADIALYPSWIIPVVPRGRVLSDCAVVVRSGEIVGLCPRNDVAQRFRVAEHLELPGQVVIPGLINSHGHTAMTLLRGFADDKALMTWLEQHIWPAEQRWVSADFVRDGSTLAMAEMLASGTTCFADMYFYPEETAAAAFALGMRCQITSPVLDFPSRWASSADEYLHKGLALHDDYRSHELITIGFGPHAPYTVSDEPLRKIATYAEELQAPVQIHLHETAYEVNEAQSKTGLRPAQRLADLGLLSPLTQCVHMTQVDAGDIALLQQSGAHVVHCPESNLKLASGICPVQSLLDAGVNVCLGTDGAASNNDLNLFGELKTAALLAKLNDAEALNTTSALELATINGARAMGLEDKIGSIEVGKRADLTAVDLSGLAQAPLHSPISQLVYTDVGHRVSHVWVDGRLLVKNRLLVGLSETALLENARDWQEKIQGPH